MTSEQIANYLGQKQRKDNPINIYFKDRNTITGIFIEGGDFNELKNKNFWRIVSSLHFDEWKQTKNVNLAKIFNGLSFTRLSEEKVKDVAK